ncbi:hypothetical protein [Nocardia veterana]|uniref:Uncharacterized protein n=1 Tax=Nocardia veterana TaxID=132249 RepID=A0A7X6M297_9NOCA|nr:hypothetical protein [Nocardia veterana]NKY88948.1 hypothetical protein [Nocardia veterana]
MFEHWPEQGGEQGELPLHRVVVPPMPVLVDIAAAIPTHPHLAEHEAVAGPVRAGGLDMTGRIPGRLHAWARAADGTWLGLVEFELTTGNRRSRLPVTQWCPAHALIMRGGCGPPA